MPRSQSFPSVDEPQVWGSEGSNACSTSRSPLLQSRPFFLKIHQTTQHATRSIPATTEKDVTQYNWKDITVSKYGVQNRNEQHKAKEKQETYLIPIPHRTVESREDVSRKKKCEERRAVEMKETHLFHLPPMSGRHRKPMKRFTKAKKEERKLARINYLSCSQFSRL